MFESKYNLEDKRDRVESLKREIDKSISLCKQYINEFPHEFIAQDGTNLQDILNELESLKNNLHSEESMIKYRNLLKKLREAKDFAVAQQINLTKKNLQRKSIKVTNSLYDVPYIEGLASSIKKAENIYYREMNLVPKWDMTGETYEDYSKRLAMIIDEYDCKIIELENKRFFR